MRRSGKKRGLGNMVVRRAGICERLEPRMLLAGDPAFDVLVFTKTAGFRHGSIAAGINAVENLAEEHGFSTLAAEDARIFNDRDLAPFEAVIFLNTTGNVLNTAQEAAFQRYIRAGGGFVGIHAAADTEHDWAWYGDLVGARFASHPAVQTGTVVVADRFHASTEGLPERWEVTDEWYNFNLNPRGQVHVLATLDERTYTGGQMGFDHPVAWAQEFDGGRSWYTGRGHTSGSFREPLFQEHLLGGIQYAAGFAPADVGATLDRNYEKVELETRVSNPMQLDVAPDGTVYFIERGGTMKAHLPEESRTVRVGALAVTTEHEDGLLGIALDPNFAENAWVYLFYSPSGPVAEQRVSRFTIVDNRLDMGSEETLLRIPVQRSNCCHSAGALGFGPDGDLYISTGDNTNPFASSGYAPIDERPGRSDFDAQKSSSNTDDLRGKILRIHPEANGAYSIPEGNLFPADGSQGRPEIFVMGNRNPFRFSVDSETGWLYWGDVGPDAGSNSDARGPRGHDEINQAREAGNYGWPYFVANNLPYRDYDFARQLSGITFDPLAPVNRSLNNTGAELLPPAQPAWIWYPGGRGTDFPELGTGGRTAMAGPVHHFDPATSETRGLPEYFDDTLFIYEWSRGWIQEVKIDSEGNVLKINPFLPSFDFRRPIDMKISPDGAMYLLEWGSNFGGGNADAKLVRIDYTNPLPLPSTHVMVDQQSGEVPLEVGFSGEMSRAAVDGPLEFAWDFESDGVVDATGPEVSFTYARPGTFTATLTVTDAAGGTSSDTVDIVVTGTPPVAVDDLFQVAVGVTLEVGAESGLLANDDGVGLSAMLGDLPTHGDLTLFEDGSFRYVPRAGFFGVDTFTYSALAGQLSSEPRTVTIEVRAPGDANLDGRIDLNDFSLLKANFGMNGTTWGQGDFDGDGDVDLEDFTALKDGFGQIALEAAFAIWQ